MKLSFKHLNSNALKGGKSIYSHTTTGFTVQMEQSKTAGSEDMSAYDINIKYGNSGASLRLDDVRLETSYTAYDRASGEATLYLALHSDTPTINVNNDLAFTTDVNLAFDAQADSLFISCGNNLGSDYPQSSDPIMGA